MCNTLLARLLNIYLCSQSLICGVVVYIYIYIYICAIICKFFITQSQFSVLPGAHLREQEGGRAAHAHAIRTLSDLILMSDSSGSTPLIYLYIALSK